MRYIHSDTSGTMGVNPHNLLSIILSGCRALAMCISKSNGNGHVFSMHRLKWMNGYMKWNGMAYDMAFLHTVKRLMITLVSFCKRIQCVNEIDPSKQTSNISFTFVWDFIHHSPFVPVLFESHLSPVPLYCRVFKTAEIYVYIFSIYSWLQNFQWNCIF